MEITKLAHTIYDDSPWMKDVCLSRFGTDTTRLYGASVRFNPYGCCSQFAGGTDTESPENAVAKAIIEAYERFHSMQWRSDVEAPVSAIKLDASYLDPTRFAPLSKKQTKLAGLKKLDDDLLIDWVEGYDLKTKKQVMVPADLVFYGCDKRTNSTNHFYRGNSSGVAAHTNYDEAIKLATLELIERDRIMCLWFLRNFGVRICEITLGEKIKSHKDAFLRMGCDMKFFLLPSHFATTILAIITGKMFPFFASGAAASYDSPKTALMKAIEEAEFNYYSLCGYCGHKPLRKQDVFSPMDHGMYYAQSAANARKLNWLSDIVAKIDLDGCPKTDFESVQEKLQLYVVDIVRGDLNVVRVLCPSLLPISFGYGMELYLHPMLDDWSNEYYGEPHFFS